MPLITPPTIATRRGVIHTELSFKKSITTIIVLQVKVQVVCQNLRGDILAEFLFYKTIVDWDKVAFPASTSF